MFRAQKGIKMVAVHLCPDYLNDTVSEPCLDKACVLDVCMNAATGNRHFFCFKCRIDPSSSPPSPDKIRLQRPRGNMGTELYNQIYQQRGGARVCLNIHKHNAIDDSGEKEGDGWKQ